MRPRILVLNQYYRPGVEATANLLADLCESLALDYDVTVVTGELFRDATTSRGGATDWCTRPANPFDRIRPDEASPSRRNYATYLGDSLVRALSLGRQDLVICMTDPPIVGDLGVLVARRCRAPLLVISEDVFPRSRPSSDA